MLSSLPRDLTLLGEEIQEPGRDDYEYHVRASSLFASYLLPMLT